MEQSPGLSALWAQGDVVSHAVAGLLLAMSLASWAVMAAKGWQLWRLRAMARRARQAFWHTHSFAEGLLVLAPNRAENPFRALAEDGREAAAHHAQARDDLHGALLLSDWLTSCLQRALDEAAARLQGGMAVLASVGSVAPFVGLFGTVWGIYHALMHIGQSGQASLGQVAGPVGESLVMTALGLAVAIPAVLGFNTLTRGNKQVHGELKGFAHDLHAYWVTGARVGAAA